MLISTNLTALFLFLLLGHRKYSTHSVYKRKSNLTKKKPDRCKGIFLLFILSWFADWLWQTTVLWSAVPRTVHVLWWLHHLCGHLQDVRKIKTHWFLCPSKTVDFPWSIITPWKQNLWGSSLQQPTKFNLGQWPPCKLLFTTFMNRQAFQTWGWGLNFTARPSN